MRKVRLITDIIGAAMILGYIIFLVLMWKSIPGTIATHFNALGEADAYGPKSTLILEPVFMVIMFITLAIVECIPSMWNFPVKKTPENTEILTKIGFFMLCTMKMLLLAVFMVTGFGGIFENFPAWPFFTLMGLIAVVVVGSLVACFKVR